MALYKDSRLLQLGTGMPFDTIYNPGHPAPAAGIYHCTGCNNEVVSHLDSSLPPENHHQHGVGQGAIRWRLAVATNP